MKDKKVNKGKIWHGYTWGEAIVNSIKDSDCGIEVVYKYKYPDRLLDDTTIFSHYQMFGFGNRRKYITRIPKSLNIFVEKKVKEMNYSICSLHRI